MKAIVLMVLVGLALWSTTLKAQTLVMGKEQPISSAFCTKAVDAVAVATADAADGPDAAVAVMKTKDCGMAQALVTPHDVIFSAKTKRGATVRVLEVSVEMKDGTKKTFYMLSDVDVEGLSNT